MLPEKSERFVVLVRQGALKETMEVWLDFVGPIRMWFACWLHLGRNVN